MAIRSASDRLASSIPLFLNVADLKLKIVRGDSLPSRPVISSALKRSLKKSRSENCIPACESASLAVLQVPHPTHQYKLTSCAILHSLARFLDCRWVTADHPSGAWASRE